MMYINSSRMGHRTSKVIQSPTVESYSDSYFLGKNYQTQKTKIEAIYSKKIVRFVGISKHDVFVSDKKFKDCVTVVYDTSNHTIKEILHE
jgi:hypothetical protein